MDKPTFQVKIITPEAVYFDGLSVSLIAPGHEGYLGILRGHAPLVTPLLAGEVTLKTDTDEQKKFQIEGGFLEVSRNQVLLLVEKIRSQEAATA